MTPRIPLTPSLKATLLACALLAATAAAPNPAPDLALGLWRTPDHAGLVRITRCGSSICGTAISSTELAANPALRDAHNPNPALRSRPLANLLIAQGFTRTDQGWTDGQIYDPEDGRTYHARITLLDPTHIRLRGCVFFPLCKSQTWTRAP